MPGMKTFAFGMLFGLAALAPGLSQASWRELDPEQVLVIDTSKGAIMVEMRPDMAPQSVARVKLLSREKVYDGLQFHRVISDFVAQTGNPDNRDGGASAHPNLPPEFIFKLTLNSGEQLTTRASDATQGLLGSVPFQGTPIKTGQADKVAPLRAWGAYCAGVAGMGRQEDRSTGNSEVFFMLQPARRLDRDYSVWGRIVVGMEVLKAITPGEPPAQPDVMRTVRVLADLPPAGRPRVDILSGPALQTLIDQARRDKGADFSICDVVVPVRVTID